MIYSDMNRVKLSEIDNYMELERHLKMQPLLLNLVSFADNNGIRPRPYYIEKSRKLFEQQLVSYIVRNFYSEEGFYPVYMQGDVLFQKAIELIESGKASPDSVRVRAYNGNFPDDIVLDDDYREDIL